LATGSDIAGSIRVPAAHCGVVGFKPAYGQIAGLPPFTLDTYCHDGPLARTVADVELLTGVLTAATSKDAAAWGGALAASASAPDDRVPGLRVGLAVGLGDFPVDVEVATHTAAAGERLAEAGVEVIAIELPWRWEEIARIAWIHYGHIFAAAVAPSVEEAPDLVMPYTARFVERGLAAAAEASFHEGLVGEAQVHDDLAQVFADVDVLVCPTVGHTGLHAGDDYIETRVRIGHNDFDPWDVAMTVPFNIASRCPVLNVPVGIASNGLPTGVQIVGPPYRDADVWRVGRVLEQPFTPPVLHA
jgi:aspartyl-tRNA(Asn)/glutamyl-tRNA(Gln) amidotransferase subunit A